jgi:4-hydroxy-L-threonine phosphate dehydrogenase PdxA
MTTPNQKRKVGITLGDVAGIGPEIIMKTFSEDHLYKHFTPIFIWQSESFIILQKDFQF